jgi:hypothetical protein
MKQFFVPLLLLCGLWPFSSTAQIGVADPVTGNATINFYGRVVDQDGKPLAGAHVGVSVSVGYLPSPGALGMKDEKSTQLTDANGNFILTDANGHSLKIESIDVHGYKLSEKVKRSYAYSWSGDIFHPDPTNPVVFKMWKMQGPESLVGSVWHGNVSCDGSLTTFDLLRGKRVKDGNLQISCVRTPLISPPPGNGPFDYKFEIAVVGGGVQPTEDEFTYLAPEKGYAPSFIEAKKPSDPGWRGRLTQAFYFRTEDGHYGTLFVDWYTAQNSPTHLEWTCSINPSGSRNLER